MSTVNANSNAVKSATSTTTAASTTTRNLEQVALAAAAKVVDKEFSRDCLDAGESAHVELSLVGVIDGERVLDRQYNCELTVGHDSVRASSATPNQSLLVATLLSKMNTATRDAVVRDIPDAFASNGDELPAVDEAFVTMAESLLKRLRAKKEQKVRGSVSVKYAAV